MEIGNDELGFPRDIIELTRNDCSILYSKPSNSIKEALILKLKSLDESRSLKFQLLEVQNSSLPYFLHDMCFVDCLISVDGDFAFLSNTKETCGSGVGSDFLSSSCHAIGEALERHLGFLGGTKDSRPNLNSMFSLGKQKWIDQGYNPFGNDPKLNPFYVPCGQACHPVLKEAFRNALVELLERQLLATVNVGNSWFDITDSLASEDTLARDSKKYWESIGFNFKVNVTLSPFGGFVAVASAETKGLSNAEDIDCSKFGKSFRGSGADFGLEYAPMQAISELNRSAFFGPYLNINSYEDCRTAQSRLSDDDYYFGYLDRLMNGDWLTQVASRESSQISTISLRDTYTVSIREVVQNLIDEYGDVFVIPFATPESAGVYGLKIAVPGFNVSSISRTKL